MAVSPKADRATDRIVAALDVGSSKVAAMIAVAGADGGAPRVLGVGARACAGVRRGLVADMEKTESAIRAAMEQAERNAGLKAERVFVGLASGGLGSEIASVEIDIAGHRIERQDIDRAHAQGRDRVDPAGRVILHAQPALYTVDGVTGVTNPLGFHASRLRVDIHVVTADVPPLRNLDLCVRNAHLGVDTVVASGVASGLSVLAGEERELGVALVEIGAGVTTVTVHGGGVLVGMITIPMGAQDITDDIAASFATRRASAERMKVLYGSAVTTPRDNHDLIEVPPMDEDGAADARKLPRAQLIGVIRERLDHLFSAIARALADMGFSGPAGRQIVLTGGGAELKSIADYAQGSLGRAVRVGRPRGLTGLPDAQAGAGFSSLAGLILFAANGAADIRGAAVATRPEPADVPRGAFGRMVKLLKSNI